MELSPQPHWFLALGLLNLNPAPSSVSTSALNAILNQIQVMENQIAQLSNQLVQIKIAIKNLSAGSAVSPSLGTTAPSVASTKYKFSSPLSYGNVSPEVAELQKRLTAEGFYSGPVSSYFGALTEAAVKVYQSAHGLDPLGHVGPGTRAELNK